VTAPPHTGRDPFRLSKRHPCETEFPIVYRRHRIRVGPGIHQPLPAVAGRIEWIPAPHVHEVLIWRTADGDGIDGGGVLTVDLNYLGERIRLASLHQGYDDFTTDTAAHGIDVAVEALAYVAATVNREYTTFCRATALTVDSDRDAEHTALPNPIQSQETPARLPSARP
jgi:hypothetical protein